MQLHYRQVINNIALKEEEANTLYNALEILKDSLEMINNEWGIEKDSDLVEYLSDAINSLAKCNARLNIDIILGHDD